MLRLLFFAFIISSCSQLEVHNYDKGLNLGFYPSEYTRLGNESWDTIKAEIDKLRQFDGREELKSNGQIHVWFLLNRLPTIEWTSEQRKTIANYLGELSIAALSEKKYFKGIKLEEKSCGKGVSLVGNIELYPLVAIWAELQIDKTTGYKTCETIFNNRGKLSTSVWTLSRSYLLGFLGEYYKENEMLELVSKITPISEDEEHEINKMIFGNSVFNSSSQDVAWQKIWEDFTENIEVDNKVATWKNASAWRRYNLLMIDIYDSPSIDGVLNIVKADSNPIKKYLFLYSACFLSNNSVSKNEKVEIAENTLSRLVALTEDFYKSEKLLLDFKESELDFLDKAYKALISRSN